MKRLLSRSWGLLPKRLLTSNKHVIEVGKSYLFGCRGLLASADFPRLSAQATNRVDELVHTLERITQEKQHLADPQRALYLLDSVSNELCAVVDAAELCRNVHDDDKFRDAAEQAFSDLMSSIHTLNARISIYHIINDIYCSTDVFQGLSDEEKMFVIDMKTEYEAEGITLPQELKSTLLDLQNEIVSIETDFLNNCNSDHTLFELGHIAPHNLSQLRNWIETFVPQRQFDDAKSLPSSIVCTSSKRVSLSLLKSLQSDSSRESLWYQIWFEPYDNMAVLGSLIQKRQALSALLQKPSFAHKYLEKQAIKSPAEVRGYLELLSAKTRPQAERELGELTDLQRRITGNSQATLQPWGVSFYTTLHTAMNKEFKKESAAGQDRVSSERHDQEALSQYLSLGHCLQGLISVSRELFGIEFVHCPLDESESWLASSDSRGKSSILSMLSSLSGVSSGNGASAERWDEALRSGVFKFDVYDHGSERPDNGKIGTVYLDLYNRREKFPGSALFSLQGGCRVSFHNLDASLRDLNKLQLQNIPFQPAHVALVMSLSAPVGHTVSISAQLDTAMRHGPLLTLHEAETLHHEWGHMLHSLLSRTAFQHLSGTRTAMDFSEVCSICTGYTKLNRTT